MELRHLRYFAALAECLSFTRAAERVHVTQSTLSHQIRQLEEELGHPLFERVGKRVVMTERGELFLDFVERALREVDRGVASVAKPAEAGGTVRAAATHTFNMELIPECAAEFVRRYPGCKLGVLELPADEIARRLADGELDIGISYRPEAAAALRFEPLYNEELVLVVAPGHPLAGRRRIRMADLGGEQLVLVPEGFGTRTLLEECFRSCGAAPVVVAEMTTVPPMLGLVARTRIGAIVAANAVPASSPLRRIAIERPTPFRTPGILWKTDTTQSIPVRSFAAIVRKCALRTSMREWPDDPLAAAG